MKRLTALLLALLCCAGLAGCECAGVLGGAGERNIDTV